MVSMTQERTAEEKELLEAAARWFKVVSSRNLDELSKMYCPEVSLYDVKPPFVIKGREAYRAMWEQCLPHMPKQFEMVQKGLNVMASGEYGFMHSICKFVSPEKDHPACLGWVRVTVCYKKVEGKWYVVHEHVSIPFNPMTGQVAPILDDQVAAAGM